MRMIIGKPVEFSKEILIEISLQLNTSNISSRSEEIWLKY
jgi:hypothetical protein